MYQLTFSMDEFLAEYWQKKPTIIKGGFKHFIDPISPDELAGLAMEEEVDSRYIARQGKEWDVKHGPLSFDHVPEDNWSFTVQAVNHWHEGAARLVTPFRALPGWLFDDLMVSYSTPGGGVGPHIDQYDVFIVQGSGKRHWRVGPKKDDYEEEFGHPALRHVKGFDPIIDEILEAGDILYIPPGFPHDGYAIETAMSFSIGFRSPKKQELLSSFADYVIANDIGDVHYHNPKLHARKASGAIPANEFADLEGMLRSLMDHPQLMRRWLGEHLSNNRHDLDVIAAEPPWQQAEIYQFLESGEALKRLGGLRAFYYPEQPHVVFINGETYELPEECGVAATYLCDEENITQNLLGKLLDHPAFIALLTQLVNQGYWYPVE
ncbi:ribosomal protein uL16 3-hydroxylase [Photobacterium ganghwense]|uniref:50S ribosomal protein L16 arginine hydroxylase n=1 Tax=Photobacterium ganghwense TaxID=320778 RepID=A0A0J1HGM5_9GAMM|nr:cupin domain-containing protein [Photobacterium ganghwense]KLV10766.1 50S ribosomal protein L16 arginine hydroxylase [Photobacterium ganghwense]MBV1842806.1 cupin domain-containing protein [Photobacterium ganghwense]PSU11062.1 cupin domain-containing protein [Photobacterium ganghwense]QSV13167.1 cupin domain-containing protein [Photobacterium ganghwense]